MPLTHEFGKVLGVDVNYIGDSNGTTFMMFNMVDIQDSRYTLC